MKIEEELKNLYLKSSKHSNYQILPQELADVLELDENKIMSTYEKERFDYICNKILLQGKRILDIGGNTGYFTFESIKRGCCHVDYFEGNVFHAEFVRKAKAFLCINNIDIHPVYYLFEKKKKEYDVAFCLNVVHHLGDDFFCVDDINLAKQNMLKCINDMSFVTEYLVFQMGYNWCGDCSRNLFLNGTKKEVEEFIAEGTAEYWNLVNIGIAEKRETEIIYNEMNDTNNNRMDELGEFLNRPLFIMKSKMEENH